MGLYVALPTAYGQFINYDKNAKCFVAEVKLVISEIYIFEKQFNYLKEVAGIGPTPDAPVCYHLESLAADVLGFFSFRQERPQDSA